MQKSSPLTLAKKINRKLRQFAVWWLKVTQSSIIEWVLGAPLSSLGNDLRLELRCCVLLVLVLICSGIITLTFAAQPVCPRRSLMFIAIAIGIYRHPPIYISQCVLNLDFASEKEEHTSIDFDYALKQVQRSSNRQLIQPKTRDRECGINLSLGQQSGKGKISFRKKNSWIVGRNQLHKTTSRESNESRPRSLQCIVYLLGRIFGSIFALPVRPNIPSAKPVEPSLEESCVVCDN